MYESLKERLKKFLELRIQEFPIKIPVEISTIIPALLHGKLFIQGFPGRISDETVERTIGRILKRTL